MKPSTRCCTVSAMLFLAGCANTQQVIIDQPEGYQATAYVAYHNKVSDRCRSSFSIGMGHWLYMPEKTRRVKSQSTGPAQFDIPDRIHRGLCTQYLQRVEIETTPDYGGKPVKLARLDFRPASHAATVHEVRLDCNHLVSLDKTDHLRQESWCWPHGKSDIGWSVQHVSSHSRLDPVKLRLDVPTEPDYVGRWIRVGDQHIPYQLVHERPSMSRVELRQIRHDGLNCSSHPTCKHGIEASKALDLAVLHAKVTYAYWAHSGPDTPAIYEKANASDWISVLANKLYRWEWQRQDQMNLLMRSYLYAQDVAADPAWEPLPGEEPEAHFQRCKRLFNAASYARYQLNQIKSEVGRWIAFQPSALREDIFKKERHRNWIDEQIRDLHRWKWTSRDQVSLLLKHRASEKTPLACEPRDGEEPGQHFRRCRRLFEPVPKQ